MGITAQEGIGCQKKLHFLKDNQKKQKLQKYGGQKNCFRRSYWRLQNVATRELAVKSFLAGEENFFLSLTKDLLSHFDLQTDLLNQFVWP
jgi:hypothetical protein